MVDTTDYSSGGPVPAVRKNTRTSLPLFAILLAAVVGMLISQNVGFASIALVGWAPLLLTRHARYGVYLLALSVAFNITVLNDPVHLSLPQLVGLFMITSVLIRLALRSLPQQTEGRFWAWSGFVFATATIPSIIGTDFPTAALAGTIQIMLVSFVIFTATKLLIAYPRSVEKTLELLAIAAVISVIPAFIQTAFGVGPESFVRSGIMRAHSTYGQPNSYGLYLAGMVPLFFGLTTYKRVFVIPLLVTSVALLATLSRGAIAGTSIAVTVFLIAHRSSAQSRGIGFLMAIFLPLIPFGLAVMPSSIISGLTDFGDWSSQQRALTLLSSVAAIRARPILGYGSGSFASLRPDIALAGLVDDIEMPHNFVVEIWLELGILALVCFVILVAFYYFAALRMYRRRADPVLASLVAAFTGMLATSLTASLFIRGVEEVFALIVALTAARVVWLRKTNGHENTIAV